MAHLLIISSWYHDRGSKFLALLVTQQALSDVKSTMRYMEVSNYVHIPGLAADASWIASLALHFRSGTMGNMGA